MKIKQVKLNNFRIYQGNNVIDLNVDKEKNIVIISGKNGYGKTTFLMSMIWCLYGKQMADVDEIYRKEISDSGGYSKYINNSLNHHAKEAGKSTFSVSITFTDVKSIPDVPCKELIITRTHYTQNKKDELSILIDGQENEIVSERAENLEFFIREYVMPKEIAKFFFFDAERIVSLAEHQSIDQQKSLSQAYAEVLRIKQYQDLRSSLKSYHKELQKDTASGEDRHRLNQLNADIKTAEDRIEQSTAEISELGDKSDKLHFDIEKIQEKLIKEGEVITEEELDELRKNKEKLEKSALQQKESLKAHYEIIPLAISGRLLTEVFEHIKAERILENNHFALSQVETISDQIINGLLNAERPSDVIITHQVQDFIVRELSLQIKRHLGDEDKPQIDEISILHAFSEVESNDLSRFIDELRLSFKEKFSRLHEKYRRAKNDLGEINKKITYAEEMAEGATVKFLREKKQDLQNDYDQTQQNIGRNQEQVEKLKKQLIQYKKEWDRITDRLGVSKEKETVSREVNNTIKVLDEFIQQFEHEKSEALSQRIKTELSKLMHKTSFVNKVDVDIMHERINIQLYEKNGREINLNTLSKGEQQLYATALLKSLVDESNIDFPVFIDSPMQKFDVDHSDNIVRNFYPDVSAQVVLFPLLKKEMTEREFKIILPKVSKTYLIDNKGSYASTFKEVPEKSTLFTVFEQEQQRAN